MKVRKGCIYFLVGLFLILCLEGVTQEICDNGKDDDSDRLTDLQDPDCRCRYKGFGNLVQNSSFEAFNHCPATYSFDNDARIADGWQYGTYTNGHEANYYHNFSCTTDSVLVMHYIPPALPLPNGRAFISIRQDLYRKRNFQETDIAKIYIGQCLQAPLQPRTPYTLTFSAGRFQSHDDRTFKYKTEPFTVAVFGHADCNAAPFGAPYAKSNGCPANYTGWMLLGKTTLQSNGAWVEGQIDFTVSQDIRVIEIGPDCSLLNPSTELTDSTTLLDFYVYYLDDFHLLPTKAFQPPRIRGASGDPCAKDSLLLAPASMNATYQWYKDSIAIAGATGKTYLVPPSGRTATYSVRVIGDIGCFVSEPFSMQPTELARLRLPADTLLCKGDSVQLTPLLNGILYSWNGNQDSKVQVGEAGVYTIVADANGCTRTFTVAVHELDCKNSTIYIPNAFTPNGDGKNDVFRIPPETNLKVNTFSVFNRWGNPVFSTSNNTGWDGTFNGKHSPAGTYVYLIKGRLNNQERILKGTVLLIR